MTLTDFINELMATNVVAKVGIITLMVMMVFIPIAILVIRILNY